MGGISFSPVQVPLEGNGSEGTLVYREIPPAPELRRFIACYWVMEHHSHSGAGLPRVCRVLPDGCVDVIFKFAGGFLTVFLAGTMKRHFVMELTHPVDFLGVRFLPGAVKLLIAYPVSEFSNCRVDLADLLGGRAALLASRVGTTSSLRERIRILDAFFRGSLTVDDSNPALIDYILSGIYKARGNIAIGDLANMAFMSSRNLWRLFDSWIGANPKIFCRIVRFQNMLMGLGARPKPNILNLALEYGYYDYSHFVHDFKEFSGLSPADYIGMRITNSPDIRPEAPAGHGYRQAGPWPDISVPGDRLPWEFWLGVVRFLQDAGWFFC